MTRLTTTETACALIAAEGVCTDSLATAELVDLITALCSAVACRLSCEHDLPTVIRQDCRAAIGGVREDAEGVGRALREAQTEARRVNREFTMKTRVARGAIHVPRC